jgi:hypothetical protein
VRARARERLLEDVIKSLLRHEPWDALGQALMSDKGGLRELAYRLDEVSDHTAPGFLSAWDATVKRLDHQTFCFIVEDAGDPAAYLATLV